MLQSGLRVMAASRARTIGGVMFGMSGCCCAAGAHAWTPWIGGMDQGHAPATGLARCNLKPDSRSLYCHTPRWPVSGAVLL